MIGRKLEGTSSNPSNKEKVLVPSPHLSFVCRNSLTPAAKLSELRQPEKAGPPWIQEQLLGLAENINSVCQNRTPEPWRIENMNPLAECGTEDLLGDFCSLCLGLLSARHCRGMKGTTLKHLSKLILTKAGVALIPCQWFDFSIKHCLSSTLSYTYLEGLKRLLLEVKASFWGSIYPGEFKWNEVPHYIDQYGIKICCWNPGLRKVMAQIKSWCRFKTFRLTEGLLQIIFSLCGLCLLSYWVNPHTGLFKSEIDATN